jgi:hypothetical protein
LHAARPIAGEFGVALIMIPAETPRSVAAIDLELGSAVALETRLADPGLEAARQGNPAARSLALLAALARGSAGEIVLKYVAGTYLRARVTPCR